MKAKRAYAKPKLAKGRKLAKVTSGGVIRVSDQVTT